MDRVAARERDAEALEGRTHPAGSAERHFGLFIAPALEDRVKWVHGLIVRSRPGFRLFDGADSGRSATAVRDPLRRFDRERASGRRHGRSRDRTLLQTATSTICSGSGRARERMFPLAERSTPAHTNPALLPGRIVRKQQWLPAACLAACRLETQPPHAVSGRRLAATAVRGRRESIDGDSRPASAPVCGP